MSPAAETTRLDADNPWPGLAVFDEGSRAFFHGRDAEIDELLHRIEQAPVTVLFGQSGLGKSSLLRAGLMPALRDRHQIPVLLRLDWRTGAPPPDQQLRDALQRTLAAEQVEAPPMAPDESLWAWLHRDGLELWDQRNFPCTPVFLIDQFEEVFTLGEPQPERVARWRSDLGDLAENRIPAALAEGAGGSGLQLRSMRYKLLVSLREDFLPELEGWRRALPSLGRNRMRLLPLQPAQALRAVLGPGGHLMDPALAQRIVQFVAAAQADDAAARAGNGTDPVAAEPAYAPDATSADGASALLQAMHAPSGSIEPALLSLFCRGLNDQRKRLGMARFDDALLDGAKQGILSDYYGACFDGMPDSVSRFVATELITEKGYRNSVAKDDATPAHLTDEQLDRLIDRRLLRLEERYGVLRIELTHDLLTRVVREHRDRLRREAAEARRVSEAAAMAAAQRAALEAQMQTRESQLQAERLLEAQRTNRRFRRLNLVLAAVLVLAVTMTLTAWRQRDRVLEAQQTEQKLRRVAEQQIVVAEQQRQVAEQRYQRVATGLDIKRAVLSGDRERIRQYIESQAARVNPPWRPGFTASSVPYGYRQGGREIFGFRLMPDAESAAKMRERVAVVTFRLDHPSYRNPLLVTGPERGFSAGYDGWGCLSSVVVLIEYLDPDRAPEVLDYDMCEALRR
jgi:hypothetical protein